MNKAKSHSAWLKDWNTLKLFIPYLWPKDSNSMRLRVVVSILFLVIAKISTATIPLIYKETIDSLSVPNIKGMLVVPIMLLIAYGVARIMSEAFNELRDAVFARVGMNAIREVTLKTFKNLLELSIRFHIEKRTGGLSRSIERGKEGIFFLLDFMLFSILPLFIEIILVCSILLKMYGGTFAVVTFSTIATYTLWTYFLTEWRTKFRRAMNESDNDANNTAVDSLLNIDTVKYFTNQEHELRKYDAALKAFAEATVRSRVTLSLLNIGQGIIVTVGLTCVMVMASQGVENGTMTIGDFVLVNSYLLQLYMPLNQLGFVFREMKQSLTDVEHMFILLDQKPEVADGKDAVDLPDGKGEIHFEHVSFSYDSRRPVLNDLSFLVPGGKTVAIVGTSGSGKSTIFKLLFRFYDVSSGSIKIDGVDVREAKQDSVRNAIGIVPQDSILFHDTIYYNITYGRPEASLLEVMAAAQSAQIHDFIVNLPDGYDTVVGERGLRLSGGEKQRLTIARAILKRPRILVFDEATSSLDSQTEKEVQKSLRKISNGLTTIIIAHRLSSIVTADEILVLENGSLVERGTHEQLIAQSGRYYSMWDKQQHGRQH